MASTKMGMNNLFGAPRPVVLELYRVDDPRQPWRVGYGANSGWMDHKAAYQWCSDTFGEHTRGFNNPRWQMDAQSIYRFRKKKDALWFIMRFNQ